jgi:phosphatidylethanolamine/phosphatidyl-N-methylethanolamine N-methyltransferase
MTDPVARPRLREHLLLFLRFLRHPRTIGAVAPSSPSLARRMVAGLTAPSSARVVELGPGTGAMTRAIVSRLGPSARFLAVEIEPEFVAEIRREHPTVDCVCASAADLEPLLRARDFGAVDHVISGLPFASLPIETTRDVLAAIGRALRPGGTFTTFQYLHSYWLPPAVAFRARASATLGGPPDRRIVLLNVPPAWVLTWRRQGSDAGIHDSLNL